MSKMIAEQARFAAKMHERALKGSIVSKKTESTVKFFDLEAENAKFAKDQEKSRKNAFKRVNDAELARRNTLYPTPAYLESPVSTPNPNTAFRHKKIKEDEGKQRYPLKVAPPDHIPIDNGVFVLPARYKPLYMDLRANGNSIEYAVDYIKQEIENDKREVPRHKSLRQLKRSETRVKRWNSSTEEWEAEEEPSDSDEIAEEITNRHPYGTRY